MAVFPFNADEAPPFVIVDCKVIRDYPASIGMTFGRAIDLSAHVRKGEEGSLVVYDDKIIRTETDAATGEPRRILRAEIREASRLGLWQGQLVG